MKKIDDCIPYSRDVPFLQFRRKYASKRYERTLEKDFDCDERNMYHELSTTSSVSIYNDAYDNFTNTWKFFRNLLFGLTGARILFLILLVLGCLQK